MKNVIVFTTGETSYAVELGWIREVFTFGHVTPVPHAPPAIAGVVNFRGSIISVIDIRNCEGESTAGGALASQGESALLLEVDRCQVALRAGTIDEVSSLSTTREGYLRDARGREVELLKPEELLASVRGNASEPGETLP
jgi:chemotaxis signal transduction protein